MQERIFRKQIGILTEKAEYKTHTEYVEGVH